MGSGCGVRGAGCGVWGAGCGVRGAGCGVRGAHADCGVKNTEKIKIITKRRNKRKIA